MTDTYQLAAAERSAVLKVLLTALDTGRNIAEFTDFLSRCAEHDLPDALRILIGDVTDGPVSSPTWDMPG